MDDFLQSIYYEVTSCCFDSAEVVGDSLVATYVVTSIYGTKNYFCSAEQANLTFPGAFGAAA